MTASVLHHPLSRQHTRRMLAVVGGSDRPAGTIRLVIAHGHRLTRAGLRALLEREAGLEVVGEAPDGDEAVALVRSLRPVVVLVDVDLPGVDCIETTRRVLAESPVAVLVLTASDRDGRVFGALRAGAAGRVLADREPAEVVRAVRLLARGGRRRGRRVSSWRAALNHGGSKVVELRRSPDIGGGRWNCVI